MAIRPPMKMVGVTVAISERAKTTLERQAKERGIASSVWAGQVFDIGFAAVCAREKSMPISDADLDAIVDGTLLLMSRSEWDSADIAAKLGIPEATVARIISAWRDYRRAS